MEQLFTQFNKHDWYYLLADTEQVWCTRRAHYVPADDEAFVRWMATGRTPSRLDDEGILVESLHYYALPAGILSTLNAARAEKMREIAAGHERALAGAVALNDPTPSTVAVESSLLAASDAEGLEWIRDQLAARRAELEAQVQTATNVADVEAIAVSYLV